MGAENEIDPREDAWKKYCVEITPLFRGGKVPTKLVDPLKTHIYNRAEAKARLISKKEYNSRLTEFAETYGRLLDSNEKFRQAIGIINNKLPLPIAG